MDIRRKSAFAKSEHQAISSAEMQDIAITTYTGETVRPFLNEIARLRIAVFREFPYLYEGTIEYEMKYLSDYVSSANSLIVLATSNAEIVGASTAIPLDGADPEFREPIEASGTNAREVFYFGESILLPEFRGRGLGHQFFDKREVHALKLGFRSTGFFSVIRADNHPLKPDGYRSHDLFWEKRGYSRQNSTIARFPWKQIGEPQETLQKLVFWQRKLS